MGLPVWSGSARAWGNIRAANRALAACTIRLGGWRSENLAELDGLLVGADDVEVADSVLPEGGNGLDGVLSDLQSHLQGMLVCGIDVWRIQRPVVDGPGAHGRRLALPGFDGQMAQTQKGAAVLSVGVDADQLEPEFVGVEVDGLVQIAGNHARVLQILDVVRHWSHDGRSFGTLILRCFLASTLGGGASGDGGEIKSATNFVV